MGWGWIQHFRTRRLFDIIDWAGRHSLPQCSGEQPLPVWVRLGSVLQGGNSRAPTKAQSAQLPPPLNREFFLVYTCWIQQRQNFEYITLGAI